MMPTENDFFFVATNISKGKVLKRASKLKNVNIHYLRKCRNIRKKSVC